jgi:hypothetical protein
MDAIILNGRIILYRRAFVALADPRERRPRVMPAGFGIKRDKEGVK